MNKPEGLMSQKALAAMVEGKPCAIIPMTAPDSDEQRAHWLTHCLRRSLEYGIGNMHVVAKRVVSISGSCRTATGVVNRATFYLLVDCRDPTTMEYFARVFGLKSVCVPVGQSPLDEHVFEPFDVYSFEIRVIREEFVPLAPVNVVHHMSTYYRYQMPLQPLIDECFKDDPDCPYVQRGNRTPHVSIDPLCPRKVNIVVFDGDIPRPPVVKWFPLKIAEVECTKAGMLRAVDVSGFEWRCSFGDAERA